MPTNAISTHSALRGSRNMQHEPSMFVILTPQGYVIQHRGWWLYTKKPKQATQYHTRQDALNNRPGHHPDMGGTGYRGEVLNAYTAQPLPLSAQERALYE